MLLVYSICHASVNVSCLYCLLCLTQIRLKLSMRSVMYNETSSAVFIQACFICSFRTIHTHTYIYIYILYIYIYIYIYYGFLFHTATCLCCVFQPSLGEMLVQKNRKFRLLSTQTVGTNLLSAFTHTFIKTSGKSTKNKQELLKIVC
jgi:hypothetical protein